MGLIRSIDELDSRMVPIARKFLYQVQAAGIRPYVYETLRTQGVQDAYFAQGREALEVVNQKRAVEGLWPITEQDNRRMITDSRLTVFKGVGHGNGTAMDVVPVDKAGKPCWKAAPEIWFTMGEIGELCGLDWGGRWKPLDKNGLGWDCPHFQMRRTLNAA